MAVAAEPETLNLRADKPMMRDFWPIYRARTYAIITSSQTAVVLIGVGLLEYLGITHVGWIGIFGISFVGAAMLNAVTITLIHLIGRPFRDLVQAIILVSGEASSLTPPNPNTNEYDKTGFKDILLTIYKLSAEKKTSFESNATINSVVADGLSNTSTGIAILDSDRKIIYSNHAAPVREDTQNEPSLELLFPEDDTLTAWLTQNENNKLSAERQWSRIANKLPGEENRKFYDIAASYHKGSGAETVLTFFDRTDAYTPEEDELDFIAFAAHELRGPITVIRGYLDVLEDELKPLLHDDQSVLMSRLMVSSNRLTSYINNILNASSYDRRHLKLHLVEDSLHHIYEEIADDMQLRSSTQNRLLSVDLPDTLPTVAADGNSIGEVLGNLIDNALKYSNEGGHVQVVAKVIPGFVEVSVIDRGIGMPANILPNLFHKFYRSHRSRETVAGTGIGLYICKAIVSSHGGAITARSIDNEGSTFSFTLPIYDTVAEKLKQSDNSNQSLIEHGSGWIKNHSMYKG